MRLSGLLLAMLISSACSPRVEQDEDALNESLTYDEVGQSVTYSDGDDYERYRASEKATAEMARQAVQDSIAPTEDEMAAQRVAELQQRVEKLEKDAQYRRTRDMLEFGQPR